MKTLIALILFLSTTAMANPLEETRCCVTPERNANGSIKRRADVLAAFKRIHPCPSTGQTVGACPGWQMNHVIPLACGGKDEVSNLQWLPVDIKTGVGAHQVDRFERKIYCKPMEIVK